MNARSLASSFWTWCALAVFVTVVTGIISSANDTPGNNNDTGLAEAMNTIGFIPMLLVLPLLVAAIIQTVMRRRRTA